jgi:Ala-tRNA(Pro) deacylase
MPPFGPLYGQTVYVDAVLALEPEIVFNAGTHRDAIAMRWSDFVKMVNPIVGRIAEAPGDRVAEYRLSYRE